MKQILIIGKFNQFFNDLYKTLSRYFSIQLCSDNLDMIKGILKMSNPSLIIVSASEIGEEHREMFSYINTRYISIPVVCIGKKDVFELIHDFRGCERMREIVTPVLVKDVVSEIQKILGVTTQEDEKKPDKEIKNKTVLLVDDVAVQLRAMENILKDRYNVKMATSGDMAIQIVKKVRPDLILLDYNMPGCDGREVFELIQNEENGKDVPVVFVTGVKEKTRIMEVLKMKPAGYLIKPVKREDLLDITRQILDTKEDAR